jgi:putative hemolysin
MSKKSGVYQRFIDSYSNSGSLNAKLSRVAAKVLSLKKIDYWYHKAQELPGDNFPEKVLKAMNVSYHVSLEELDRIPETGPLYITANHPFGGIEGIVLAAMLKKVRPDVKFLVTRFLRYFPEFEEDFIFVDNSKLSKKRVNNTSALKEAISFVKKGGALVIFPAGVVSHIHLSRRKVEDPIWQENMMRLMEKNTAPIVPAYFHGSNSALFHVLGLIHPALRTIRLPKELLNKRDTELHLAIGHPVPFHKLKNFQTHENKLLYLRRRTYNLAKKYKRVKDKSTIADVNMEPIIEPVDLQLLKKEIAAIPKDQVLFEDETTLIFHANYDQIPNMMMEIGRQRERTFRLVEEGTGNSYDTDEYDRYYVQIVTWDKTENAIMGGYRMGQIDKIVDKQGVEGLYVNTLFKLSKGVIKDISPGIEMGRSYVTPEYQRNYNSLMYLWKGIGHFIAKYPHYRFLFGPVSISNDYAHVSQELMIRFLDTFYSDDKLRKKVKATNPPFKKRKNIRKEFFSDDLSELEAHISDFEKEPITVPILIKHYIKLGAKFLGFNRDPLFNNALDSLIVVDLTKSPARTLTKYMGKEGYDTFRKTHHLEALD